MLLDTLVCTSNRLAQPFPIEKGLIHHFSSGSNLDQPQHHVKKLSDNYAAAGLDYYLSDRKLKSEYDEVESLLEKYTVVKVAALTDTVLQLVLNEGTLIYVTVDGSRITDVTIVRSLAKVLYGQLAFDGHVTATFMVLLCSGKVCLATNSPSPDLFTKQLQTKIVPLQSEFCYVTHLAVHGNMLLLWTPEGQIQLYSPIGPGITQLCRLKTPYRLAALSFSPHSPVIATCQLKPAGSPQSTTQHAIAIKYEILGKGQKTRLNEVMRRRITNVKSEVICARFNHATNKLVMGLSSGKMLLHCDQLNRNFTTDTAPRHALTQLHWHPSDAVFCAVLKSGFIQVYDECLQLVTTSLGGLPDETLLDLNRLFHSLKSVSTLSFTERGDEASAAAGVATNRSLLLVMERGPLILCRIVLPMVPEGGSFFEQLLRSYLYQHQYKQFSRAIRTCLYRFPSEETLLEMVGQLVGVLVTLPLTDSVFAVGAEVLLCLKKAQLSEKGCEKLGKFALKLILAALHNKLYREALKLARKLDNEQVISHVDRYAKYCGLKVTCKSPDQIKLSRKGTVTAATVTEEKENSLSNSLG